MIFPIFPRKQSWGSLVFFFSFPYIKVRLDGALSNLIQLKMSLLTAGGLG